jgi:alpha-1,4-galacturonosyltransferase
MKGHQHQQQSSSPLLPMPPPSKRRCSALAAAVPALVVCSTLLPLVYLLALHRPAGACARPRLGSVACRLAPFIPSR